MELQMFRFEKLDVWTKAVDFAGVIYRATQAFPDDERFGLTSQMRRASVSISSNIAEGSGRGSDKDFARFVQIAYGSLMEVVSQTKIAEAQSLLTKEHAADIYKPAEEVARMLSGLRANLDRR